ncbi:MAG: NlpC/P60 family protein [Acidimicrobiales bacterium]
MKPHLLIGVVAAMVAIVVTPIALLTVVISPSMATSPVQCIITGSLPGLSASQSSVVETIAGRAELTGMGDQGVDVGVTASLALTDLTNLGESSPRGVGIFGFALTGKWGPPSALTNVSEAALLFLGAVSEESSWASASPASVASEVMTGYGAASPVGAAVFAAVSPEATKITSEVVALATTQNACMGAAKVTLVGVGNGSLPASYEVPSDATPQGAEAIRAAISQLGNKYVWGAASASAGFDCSGLTMWAWAQASPPFVLQHYTVDQWDETEPLTSLQGASPGDLVLVPGSDGSLTPPNPQHVGMYVGDVDGVPWVVDAADQQLGVIAQTYSSFISGGLIAVGHIVDAGSGSA